MNGLTRRGFLAASGAVALGAGVTARPLRGLASKELRQPPAAWFPEATDTNDMAALAQLAIDAAVSAGAAYADIRVSDSRGIYVELQGMTGRINAEPNMTVSSQRSYGVRVLVDGVWGFVSGVTLRGDRMVQSAREAVAHAQHQASANAALGVSRIELANVSVERGEWTAPFEIDPFTVPLMSQIEQLGSHVAAMERVLGLEYFGSAAGWQHETRVVVSSEGTRTIQRAIRCGRSISATGPRRYTEYLRGHERATGGFELLLGADVLERAKAMADNVVRWDSLPFISFDVGRYPVALDGGATASHAAMLVSACEADRALGMEADAGGGSIFSPPRDLLASVIPQLSPQVTLEVHTADDGPLRWRWDAEGVLVRSHQLVRKGRLTNYATTRDTARLVSPDKNPTLFGCAASAQGGATVPMPLVAHAALLPSNEQKSLDDLARNIKHGLMVRGGMWVQRDTTLATARSSGTAFYVKNGVPVARVPDATFMTRTARLWKDSVEGLGDSSTVDTVSTGSIKGMPWAGFDQSVSAPAALFKEMDVVRPDIPRA